MKNNNKAQLNLIGLVFSLIAFFILWFLYLGKWLSESGKDMVTNNSLTGIEAFIMTNMNLWIFCGIIIGIATYFALR